MLPEKMETVKIGGDFPMVLTINTAALPPNVPLEHITHALEENDPIHVAGQRSPIYSVGPFFSGIRLKAKGFAYRKVHFDEVLEHEFGDDPKVISMTVANTAAPGPLKMAELRRPFPERFMGQTGHFEIQAPQPDGSFKTEMSPPRPYAAMTLDRAKNEYRWTKAFRDLDWRVDIPLGYAEFPEFGFEVDGNEIPCGGFLSLIPTSYDLRIIELMHHIPHSKHLKEDYGIEHFDADRFFLQCCYSAGNLLRGFHNMGVTLTFPHWMNFKLGVLNDEFKPAYFRESGHGLEPMVSICDLDAAVGEPNQNNLVFLANLLGDLGGLLEFPFNYSARGSVAEADRDNAGTPDYDDKRRYLELVDRVRGASKMVPTLDPVNACIASYFGVPEFDYRIEHLKPISFERCVQAGNVRDFNDDALAFMLREAFDLGTRGYRLKKPDPNEPRYAASAPAAKAMKS